MRTYGQHPHWQNFRQRDFDRWCDETIECDARRERRRSRVGGRILEVEVEVVVALMTFGPPVTAALLTGDHT